MNHSICCEKCNREFKGTMGMAQGDYCMKNGNCPCHKAPEPRLLSEKDKSFFGAPEKESQSVIVDANAPVTNNAAVGITTTDTAEKRCGCDAHKPDDDRNHDFKDCPLHVPTTDTSDTWRERFESYYFDKTTYKDFATLKAFIEKEIAAAREEGFTTSSQATVGDFEAGRAAERARVLTVIAGKMRNCPFHGSLNLEVECYGYVENNNAALQDALKD